MFVTGTIMGLIRIYDPIFRFLLKQKFYECFGEIIDEPVEGIKAQVLSSFLSSSLNIELVYIILTGITSFSSCRLNQCNSAKNSLSKEEEMFNK